MSVEFNDFFLASAGVAGALIGLLFVAVSISHDRLSAESELEVSRVRAAAALTAFTNALAVSLFALVPGFGVGWTAVVVAVLGLLFVVASLLRLARVRRSTPGGIRDGAFVVGLGVALVIQFLAGFKAIEHPHTLGPVRTISVLVIVCFLIGIARSWELIGGPEIGLFQELGLLARSRTGEPGDEQSDP
ncbi:MAG TPA: hypothetical protein VH063_06085 [Gaiellaceae bacterium]|jgi:hypothetical protein|nr:hypothetical protein [Gaiellaceae bacterium]